MSCQLKGLGEEGEFILISAYSQVSWAAGDGEADSAFEAQGHRFECRTCHLLAEQPQSGYPSSPCLIYEMKAAMVPLQGCWGD